MTKSASTGVANSAARTTIVSTQSAADRQKVNAAMVRFITSPVHRISRRYQPDRVMARSLALARAAVLLAAATMAAAVQGQTRRPMSLVDLAELPRIILPQLSPDGRTLIYLQSNADWKAGRPVWHLWRQNV